MGSAGSPPSTTGPTASVRDLGSLPSGLVAPFRDMPKSHVLQLRPGHETLQDNPWKGHQGRSPRSCHLPGAPQGQGAHGQLKPSLCPAAGRATLPDRPWPAASWSTAAILRGLCSSVPKGRTWVQVLLSQGKDTQPRSLLGAWQGQGPAPCGEPHLMAGQPGDETDVAGFTAQSKSLCSLCVTPPAGGGYTAVRSARPASLLLPHAASPPRPNAQAPRTRATHEGGPPPQCSLPHGGGSYR